MKKKTELFVTKNDNFRTEQRKAEQAYKNRGTVRWVSCEVVMMPDVDKKNKPLSDDNGKPSLIYFKQTVQGTYKVRTSPKLTKAEKKIHRRKNHTKRYYFSQRNPENNRG